MEPSAAHGGDASRIIEAKHALQRAQVSVAPFRSMTTPHVSKSRGTTWYKEQEESSHPKHLELGRLGDQGPSPEQSMRRVQIEICTH